METTKKLLIINQLPLPNELIDIIKNYVFYDIIKESKKRKKRIISLFKSNNIYYSNCEKPDRYPDCLYPVICMYDNNKRKDYFILTYCERCGKYIRRERLITYINENLHCEC